MTFNKPPRAWYKRWWAIMLYVLIALIVVFVVIYVYQVKMVYQQIKSGVSLSSGAAPYEMEKIIDSHSPWQGTEFAKVTIVEFGDFNCSRCLAAFPIVREVMAKYGSKIKFYWRNFPVVQEDSSDLALGGVCANQQNKFWEFHDRLFSLQGKVGGDLTSVARSAGLQLQIFQTCLNNPLATAQVRKDYYAAEDQAVRGTPTFFINGFKIEGVLTLEQWDKLLEQMLKIYDDANH